MIGRIFAVATLAGAVVALSGCYARPKTSDLRWTDETPSWSPDGREIVFASNRANPKQATDHLYLMTADGKHVKRLSPLSVVDARDPSFSSDGSEIVFAANVLNSSNYFTTSSYIELISAKGTNPRTLATLLPGSSSGPLWSPTGSLIAFINSVTIDYGSSSRFDLYVVRPDGSGLRRLAINIDGWAFAWSPNGETIAVSDDEHLHLIPVNAAKPVKLRGNTSFPTDQTTDIVWSPDGSKIAFVRGKQVYDGSGDINPRYLWIRDLRSGHQRRLREVPDSESVGRYGAVTIIWVPARTPTLAVHDFPNHLITAAGHLVRSFSDPSFSDAGDLEPGSSSPNGDKLLFVNGPSGSYLSAISVASVQGELYERLTQVNR